MPTECSQDSFDFGTVGGRRIVGRFDGGLITSDAGAVLLGATNKAIRLVERFASCFSDARDAEQIEHTVATLIGQRVFGLALGYEDLNDHDQLRHDPIMAVLAGKLKARRRNCAPVAGKSTLNRLEHAPEEGPGYTSSRYHKISHDADAIERLCLRGHGRARRMARWSSRRTSPRQQPARTEQVGPCLATELEKTAISSSTPAACRDRRIPSAARRAWRSSRPRRSSRRP